MVKFIKLNIKGVFVMAIKKATYKKTSSKEKNSYLDPNAMNKLSDVVNGIFNEPELSIQDVSKKIIEEWEKIKLEISVNTQEKLINTFEDGFLESVNKEDRSISLIELNDKIDAHRRQGDVALSRAKRDLTTLWQNIASGENRKFDIPWLRHTKLGEKLSNFIDKNERYIFKGFVNQAILGVAQSFSQGQLEPVVVFRGELQKLIEHDFIKDPESKVTEDQQKKSFVLSKLKGIKSMTSLFVPKGFETWKYPDGSRWYEKGKAKPSQQDIESLKLRSFKSMDFMSMPVWSVSSIEHLLSPDAKLKLEELTVLRSPASTYLTGYRSKDLDEIISEKMDKVISEHKININTSSKGAFYNSTEDSISLPSKLDFINPISRVAVFYHELTHSTMHLLSRAGMNQFGSVPYAMEELTAESVAHLLIKDLEEELTTEFKGALPEEWKKQFEEYYDRSIAYNQGWSKRFNFSDLHEQVTVADKKSPGARVLSKMMEDVFVAFMTIKSGRINDLEITKELRQESYIKNTSKKTVEKGNDLEP